MRLVLVCCSVILVLVGFSCISSWLCVMCMLLLVLIVMMVLLISGVICIWLFCM